MTPITAWALTLFLGPLMFYAFSTFTASDLPGFPLDVIDGVGDIVFLPLFNAVAVTLPDFPYTPMAWLYSAVVSAIITAGVTWQTLYWQDIDEWSRPAVGKANLGTWYHTGYVFVQTTVIIVVMSDLPGEPAVWTLLLGYLLAAGYSLLHGLD